MLEMKYKNKNAFNGHISRLDTAKKHIYINIQEPEEMSIETCKTEMQREKE